MPGVGVVVNDAARAREVLMDGEAFRKDGPGSPGDLWTPVLGPSVLLNMEGEAHRALRRRLSELFTPSYSQALCERVLSEPLAGLADRLQRGAIVDLVDTMRLMAGAVISEVIGLDVGTGDDAEREWRRLFEQGERIVSMVSLRTRRLSPSQAEEARSVLDPLGDIAAKAYAAGDESTVMGRMRALGLSGAEARGAAGAFFLTG
ncbi:cytochrome P450, partial [Actinomadura adrarensis]